MKAKRKYSNNDITVFWRSADCVHASICYTKLVSVFNPRRRPWVNLEGADTNEVLKIINECPTRALTFMWNDAEKNAQETSPKVEKDSNILEEFEQNTTPKETAELKIMRNGPILVTGDFKIYNEQDCLIKQMKVASMCRCGKSFNPPFCDGTHFKHGFKDE